MTKYLGKEVGPIGYGLMSTSLLRPFNHTTEHAIECMKAALEAGANVWNGGVFYGTPEHNSLHIVKAYFTKYPADAPRVVLSIKGCLADPGLPTARPDSSPASIRREVDWCLDILQGTKRIDVFQPARRDKGTPLAVSMRALQALVDEGKIGAIGLSEVNAATIREAAQYARIDGGVEVEYSMWFTEILDNGVAKACAELDIPIIAYSPLGSGFLTGQFQSYADLPKDDFRHLCPRFQEDVFDLNLQLVHTVEAFAARKGATPAQIALAWVAAQSALAWVAAQSGKNGLPTIIPIPGSTNVQRVKENSTLVELTDEEMEEIDAFLRQFEPKGDRVPEHMAQLNWG
uniref:NADP-dependent oxidoreductase domain-containing protein n=1 Tax=Schizophyllum commune (strain H4-8 / FGSC 9210) TaxID=578458 RepID=D8Q5Z8_SCHCM